MSPDNGSELPSPSSDSTASKSEEEESEARDGSSDPVTGLTDGGEGSTSSTSESE